MAQALDVWANLLPERAAPDARHHQDTAIVGQVKGFKHNKSTRNLTFFQLAATYCIDIVTVLGGAHDPNSFVDQVETSPPTLLAQSCCG